MGIRRTARLDRVARVLAHWRDYLRGRLPVEQSLRYSLVLATIATTAVTLFTFVAVGLGSGVEANPVMGWVIDSYGWLAFASVRYAVVFGSFGLVYRLASLEGHWRQWSEGNGRLIVAVLWVNAVRDGFVIATGVVPTFVLLRWLGIW
jgi:hypothetical protein